jgi:hypothetical protein
MIQVYGGLMVLECKCCTGAMCDAKHVIMAVHYPGHWCTMQSQFVQEWGSVRGGWVAELMWLMCATCSSGWTVVLLLLMVML